METLEVAAEEKMSGPVDPSARLRDRVAAPVAGFFGALGATGLFSVFALGMRYLIFQKAG